ncbi:hypothetical protein ACTPEF_24240, partial [Clostridioides difficile]
MHWSLFCITASVTTVSRSSCPNILSGISSSTWISYMVHYTNFFSTEHQQKATSTIILVNNLG